MKYYIVTILSFSLLLNQGFTQVDNSSNESSSENSTKHIMYMIKTIDGNELYGRIISDDGREILIETKNIGKIYIKKSNIKEISNTNETVVSISNNDDGVPNYSEYRETGPFTTRYYFTNNALPIKKGENYAMIHLFGPELHFAVSDKFSLGVMASWLASPISIAAKYNIFSSGKTHLAAGTILGTSGYFRSAGIVGGLHWLTFTVGDRKSNFSLSGGYGYFNNWQNKNLRWGGGNYNSFEFSDMKAIANVGGISSTNQNWFWNSNTYFNGFQDALFLGAGSIVPVGQKASFILDIMVVNNTKERIDIIESPDSSGIYVSKPTLATQNNTTVIFMPSMRFNSSSKGAFQVSLAGVTHKRRSGRSGYTSWPMPMVSWLRKF
jgi:hypothetical protein